MKAPNRYVPTREILGKVPSPSRMRTIRFTDEEIAWLQNHEGISPTVHRLIKEARWDEEKAAKVKK